jgi:colicin import membrane protein
MTALHRPFSLRRTETRAAVLAVLVHAAFLVMLVFGVSWQNEEAAPAMAEIWDSLPQPKAQRVEPPPQPVAKPLPQPEPLPIPKPAVRDTSPAPDPDIAIEKAKAEKLKQKKLQQAELEALEKVAREAQKQAQRAAQLKQQQDARQKIEDQDLQRRMMEESLASDARQLKQLAAQAAATQRASAVSGIVGVYVAKISAKVRGNTRVPDSLKGNPQAIFQVSLLPTGEVLTVKRLQSSGNQAYDDAVERAIYQSSPLPLPDDRDARAQFVPVFKLKASPRS